MNWAPADWVQLQEHQFVVFLIERIVQLVRVFLQSMVCRIWLKWNSTARIVPKLKVIGFLENMYCYIFAMVKCSYISREYSHVIQFH